MKIRKFFPVFMAIAALSGLPLAANAGAIYDFTFPASWGTVTGTITGTLDLPFISPGGTGSGAASTLTLTSIPAGFGTLSGGDVVTSWHDQVVNNFTVRDGVITSVEFVAFTNDVSNADGLGLNSTASAPTSGNYQCPSDLNELQSSDRAFGYNFNGLGGVAFSPVALRTPEPGTAALFGTGLIGLLSLSRRRYFRRGGA